jgi:hypothetical protein
LIFLIIDEWIIGTKGQKSMTNKGHRKAKVIYDSCLGLMSVINT